MILFTASELEDIYNCLVGAECTWQTAANDILDIYNEFKNKRKIFNIPFSFMPDNILNTYKQRTQNLPSLRAVTNKPHKLTAGEIMAKGQELIDSGRAVAS